MKFFDKKKFKQMGDKMNTLALEFQKGIKDQQMAKDILFENLNNMNNDIKQAMKFTPKAAHSYSSGRVAPHHPSKPGKPPAVDSGSLRDSYQFDVRHMEGEIGPWRIHGKFMELGTKDVDARPVLRPMTFKYTLLINKDVAKMMPGYLQHAFFKIGAKKK